MDLNGLPHFLVDTIGLPEPDGNVSIRGRLSHTRGVRNELGYLYRGADAAIVGTLENTPTAIDQHVVFHTLAVDLTSDVVPGATFPWIDGYWNPKHILMVLGPLARWQRQQFSVSAAHYFRLSGARGWQPVGLPLPDGSEDLGVRAGGIDHAHCELCRDSINADKPAGGYVDENNDWLCPTCYEMYAVPHDVSFAVED